MCLCVCMPTFPPGPLRELIFHAFTIILIVCNLLGNGSVLPLKEFEVMKNLTTCILMNRLIIKTKHKTCTKSYIK